MHDRLDRTLLGVAREVRGAAKLGADLRSSTRLAADIVFYRMVQIVAEPSNRLRSIRIGGDVELNYRLNRGDIQTIREVWLSETYRLPDHACPRVIIDLGANVGMTSLYFARKYGPRWIVAVEPAHDNAQVARLNFTANGVQGAVLEAAVAAQDGEGAFQAHRDSNLGRVASEGGKVRLVSMQTVLESTPSGSADLVKMDIEGAEGDLLGGDVGWLERVEALMIEFHPAVVDYGDLVDTLKREGFTHVPPGSPWPGTDYFERR